MEISIFYLLDYYAYLYIYTYSVHTYIYIYIYIKYYGYRVLSQIPMDILSMDIYGYILDYYAYIYTVPSGYLT